MIRLFEQHKVREQVELEGTWEFSKVNTEGETCSSFQYKLPVPGCWEMHPDMLTYRGKGVYRKNIYINETTNLQFTFKGVSHTAYVYFDGKKIVHHYNAYTQFSAVVPAVEAGKHELLVYVDNSFNEESALHIPNDYYTYGGIIRPVVMEKLQDVFIERIEFIPFMKDSTWRAKIKVILTNVGSQSKEFILKGNLNLTELNFHYIDIKENNSVVVENEFTFENIIPWSGENPQLYHLEMKLVDEANEMIIDDYIERVGFRVVETIVTDLLLNGTKIMLKGFNRHEDHPMTGAAIPFQFMVKDLDLAEDMGANCIRTCHYPNDERFLDLCDERGIFVWEENHARGLSLQQMLHKNFVKQCEDCNKEMVENHINHPSIIIWGILNECNSKTSEGRAHYERQFNQIKTMDTSRPLTFATCMHYSDICLDLVDIVSINLYSGWYTDNPVAEEYTKERIWFRESGGNNKPVIISEFGGAAIYGYRDPAKVKWSEERQADIIDECLKVYMNQEEICGTLIWQFCDCKVTEENGWFSSRARSKNNKGIVDEYRRPKLSYSVVQKHFKK